MLFLTDTCIDHKTFESRSSLFSSKPTLNVQIDYYKSMDVLLGVLLQITRKMLTGPYFEI